MTDPASSTEGFVEEGEVEDEDHGSNILQGDNTKVVEHPDDDPLEINIGDLARLLPQHVHFVVS